MLRNRKRDILLFRSPWPASGAKGRFESLFCCRFLLRASIAKRCATCKTMLKRPEFRFPSIDLPSPLSELFHQFTGTAASRRLQTGSLPVAASLNHVCPAPDFAQLNVARSDDDCRIESGMRSSGPGRHGPDSRHAQENLFDCSRHSIGLIDFVFFNSYSNP